MGGTLHVIYLRQKTANVYLVMIHALTPGIAERL